MNSDRLSSVTAILNRVREDKSSAYGALLPLVYDELKGLAAAYLRKERVGHTLQPTALVHEAYLRLVDQKGVDIQNRKHFLAVAARAMRQILIDYARRYRAAKRGGDRLRITLDEALAPDKKPDVDLIALDDALTELEKMDERKSRVVELRFFGGMTNEEAAHVLDVSPKTSEADWYMARAWLRRSMSGDAA